MNESKRGFIRRMEARGINRKREEHRCVNVKPKMLIVKSAYNHVCWWMEPLMFFICQMLSLQNNFCSGLTQVQLVIPFSALLRHYY